MRPAPAAIALLALALGACGGGKPAPSPAASGIGAQAKGLEQDMDTMREATGAANDVIRASGDCDAVKPLAAAANARLEEASRKIQTGGGRQTIEALRKKVRDAVESCP